MTFSAERKDANLRAELLSDFGWREDTRMLLFAGRISPEKNVRLLIKLMRKLKANGENNYSPFDRRQRTVAGKP